jgi:actin-related protein 10
LIGISTALVVDCGYTDTQVLPIAENFILNGLCDSINVGSKSIQDSIRKDLEKDGKINIDDSLIEDIKIKCCFVTNFNRAQKIHSQQEYEACVDCDYTLPNNKILTIKGISLLFI